VYIYVGSFFFSNYFFCIVLNVYYIYACIFYYLRTTSEAYICKKRMEIIKNSLNSFLKPRAQFEAELEPTSYLPKIPPKGTLFKEGYLMKRSRNGGNNWRRRFFVLSYKKNSEPGSSGTFSYTDTFSGEAKSKAKFAISGKATVRFSDMFKDAGYNSSQCLEILPNTEDEGQPPLYIASSDRNDITSWKAAIEACIAKSRGDTYQFEDVCSRFYEGTLFKTNREADTWMVSVHNICFEILSREVDRVEGCLYHPLIMVSNFEFA